MADDKPNGLTIRLARINPAFVLALFVQIVGIVIWLWQLNANDAQQQKELTMALQRLSAMESLFHQAERNFDRVAGRQQDVVAANTAQDARMRELENKINENWNKLIDIQQQIAILSTINKRLDEQQNRIIQSLDSTHNLINEHLRGHGQPSAPKPRTDGGSPF